jgi:hypothetical protein
LVDIYRRKWLAGKKRSRSKKKISDPSSLPILGTTAQEGGNKKGGGEGGREEGKEELTSPRLQNWR